MLSIGKRLAAILAVGVMSLAIAAPATAQNKQEGLVNVALENITVQVPISVAANICDVNVAVLAELADQGSSCEATADSAASAGPSQGNGTQQEGLVNVLVSNVLVQVPIAVAANVCDVNVVVLADVLEPGPDGTACQAVADSTATQPGGGGGGNGANANAFAPIDLDAVINLRILDGDLST